MFYSSGQGVLPYGGGAMGCRNMAVERRDTRMLQSEDEIFLTPVKLLQLSLDGNDHRGLIPWGPWRSVSQLLSSCTAMRTSGKVLYRAFEGVLESFGLKL